MPSYSYVAVLDNTQPNQVLNDASFSQNMVNAINATPEYAGIRYSLPTQENAAFKAGFTDSLNFFVVVKEPGTVGNSYGLSETSANFSWAGSHATGGTDGVTTELTVGVLGAGAGQGLLYTRGSNAVTASTAPAAGTSLLINYYRLGADRIRLEDSALVAARALIEHGTGRSEVQMQDTATSDPIVGTARAKQVLSQYGVLPDVFTFNSYTPGLRPGQWLTISMIDPAIIGPLVTGTWQIQGVRAQYAAGQKRFLYSVTVASSTIASLISFYEALSPQK